LNGLLILVLSGLTYQMEKSITFVHKKLKREFIVSSKTKPNTLKNLVKKALHLHSEIKYLKSHNLRTTVDELIFFSKGG